MSNWRSTVAGQAEQVVEHFGISEHNVNAVETLTDDPLFQELAIAQKRADQAQSVAYHGVGTEKAGQVPEDSDLADGAFEASEDLLALLRDRGADLLLAEAFDVEEGSA